MNISQKKNDVETQQTYAGVPGTRFIWHGEWADPEIEYKRHLFNYWDVAQAVWDSWKDECLTQGVDPVEELFDGWCSQNVRVIKDILDNFLFDAINK